MKSRIPSLHTIAEERHTPPPLDERIDSEYENPQLKARVENSKKSVAELVEFIEGSAKNIPIQSRPRSAASQKRKTRMRGSRSAPALGPSHGIRLEPALASARSAPMLGEATSAPHAGLAKNLGTSTHSSAASLHGASPSLLATLEHEFASVAARHPHYTHEREGWDGVVFRRDANRIAQSRLHSLRPLHLALRTTAMLLASERSATELSEIADVLAGTLRSFRPRAYVLGIDHATPQALDRALSTVAAAGDDAEKQAHALGSLLAQLRAAPLLHGGVASVLARLGARIGSANAERATAAL